jgi:hypothetical protein
VRLADIRGLVEEGRGLGFAVRGEASVGRAGPIVVSGMLAEQLAKELGAGAAPGAVIVGSTAPMSHVSVRVHVIAGDPTPEDEALVRSAVDAHVEVVLVELWPQADWTPPFVLSPYVVEVRAGEGFPIEEIATRIVEATGDAPELASRVPALAPATRNALVNQAVVRAALTGFLGSRLGSSRPQLVREQALTLARLRTVSSGTGVSDEMPVLAGGAVGAIVAGIVLREVARRARGVVPAPLAQAAIAAAGTWAIAKAFDAIESRLPAA